MTFKKSELNPMWRGDAAGYDPKHVWARKYVPKPELCVICKLVPPYDVHNISGKYLREIDDWEYRCRRCHMEKDGRLERFKKVNLIDMSNRICFRCGNKETNIQKRNGRPRWYNLDNQKICHKCYMKEHDKRITRNIR